MAPFAPTTNVARSTHWVPFHIARFSVTPTEETVGSTVPLIPTGTLNTVIAVGSIVRSNARTNVSPACTIGEATALPGKLKVREFAPPKGTVAEPGVPGVSEMADEPVGVALAAVEAGDSPPAFTAVTMK